MSRLIAAAGNFAVAFLRPIPRSGVFVAAIWFALSSPALAADKCRAADRTLANQALTLSAAEQSQALKAVFPWGAPTGGAAHERRLVQRDYVLDYDDVLLGPAWSADALGLKPLVGGRLDCFRQDPRLPPESASAPSDFDEPIFDQGHMVPNGDMSFDAAGHAFDRVAVMNSFVMSNMSPQFCQFNRGVWQILETFVRGWANQGGPLYVINGAVFDRDGDGRRDADSAAVRMLSRNGQSRVAVPSGFYKILARRTSDGSLETLTVLLPHDQTDLDGQAAHDYLAGHVTDLAVIQRLTGMTFFPEFHGARREASSLWATSSIRFRSLVDDRCRAQTEGAHVAGPSPGHYVLH